jgi:hypothetical protein
MFSTILKTGSTRLRKLLSRMISRLSPPAVGNQGKDGSTGTPSAGFTPGLNCPRCATRFPVTIPQLLSGQPIFCPSCKLQLNLDRSKSSQALESLNKLQNDFEIAQEMVRKSIYK